MSTLCYSYRGEPFVPPPAATSWRVRRLREGQRGQLDVVRDDAGQPVVLPIAATYEQLRAAVGQVPGRYRLDMLDEHGQVIDGDAAYVTVATGTRNAAPSWTDADSDDNIDTAVASPRAEIATVTAPYGTWPALPQPVAMTAAEYLVAEALRGQVLTIGMLTNALSERSAASASGASQMIGAAAGLVRAADGAAMPSRRPPPPPLPSAPTPTSPPAPPAPSTNVYDLPRNAMPESFDDDDDGDQDDQDDQDDDERATAAAAEQDMFAKLMTIADKVQGVIAPVADVARMVMGGYGNPAALRNAGEVDEPSPEAEPSSPSPEVPRHLYASHMLLVAHELGARASRFRRLLLAMDGDERAALTARLCALSIDEAVAEAAALLARIDARRRRAHDVASDVGPIVDTSHQADADNSPGDASFATMHDASTEAEGISPTVTATLAQGAQLAMVPTASLEPVAAEHRTVTPPPGVPVADVAAAMKAIASHLSAFELLRVQSLLGATPQAERDAWIAKLLPLSPADAAAVVRAELARRAG